MATTMHALRMAGEGVRRRVLAPVAHRPFPVRLLAAVIIGWVPLVVLAGAERLVGDQLDPLLLDLSVHARLFVAVPLFLVAERMLTIHSRRAMQRLGAEGFIAADERARFARLGRLGHGIRHARLLTAVLTPLSLLVAVARILGWWRPGNLTPALLWLGLVGQPLFIFLLCRCLWRWTIWIRVVIGLARLRLQLEASHPDRHAGIGFLVMPSLAFHAPFLFGVSVVLNASWGMRVLTQGAGFEQLKGLMIVFAVIGELLAFGPLLVLTPRLVTAVARARHEYGALANDYVRRFRERWLTAGRGSELLGTPDLQSLNDLSCTYRESIDQTIPLLVRVRDLVSLLVVMLLPSMPLLLTRMPIALLLTKLAKLFLGGH
jgi:hypothetical protein